MVCARVGFCHLIEFIISFHVSSLEFSMITVLKSVVKAAAILRLLGNETIQFNTQGKKSEPGLRKQLNIDVKSTTKFYLFFKYMSIFIYITNIRRFRFSILYFKYLQTLILCVTTFYKTAFYYNVF